MFFLITVYQHGKCFTQMGNILSRPVAQYICQNTNCRGQPGGGGGGGAWYPKYLIIMDQNTYYYGQKCYKIPKTTRSCIPNTQN